MYAYQDRHELVRQCLNVGHEQLADELSDGVGTWHHAEGDLQRIPLVSFAELHGDERLLDVRQANEWDELHIPDATHIELGALPATEPPAGPLAVMCAHGQCSMTAASPLSRRRGPGDLSAQRNPKPGRQRSWAFPYRSIITIANECPEPGRRPWFAVGGGAPFSRGALDRTPGADPMTATGHSRSGRRALLLLSLAILGVTAAIHWVVVGKLMTADEVAIAIASLSPLASTTTSAIPGAEAEWPSAWSGLCPDSVEPS